MAITKLDYKLQGSNLKNAVDDVFSRSNAINGRYQKGGGFGLDFYSENYEIENYHWITERANIADNKIKEAESEGKDVDNPEILKGLAVEVDQIVKAGKSNGSYINYIIYLGIPIVILIALFLIFT